MKLLSKKEQMVRVLEGHSINIFSNQVEQRKIANELKGEGRVEFSEWTNCFGEKALVVTLKK